jgi:hypothetical protein
MFDSKPLKEDPEPKKARNKLLSWWYCTPIYAFWDDWSWKLWGKPLSHIKKVWGWYWNVFRYDFDFDGHSLFAIIEYKLKRVQRCLEKGVAWQEPKDMKALKIAIKLAGRLKEDNYDMVTYDRHEKKWGPMQTWTTPCQDSDFYTWHSSRPRAVFREQKEEERKDRWAGLLAAEAKCKREEKWLYDILHKYLRKLWD